MKIPCDLSGAQWVKDSCRDWGYRVVDQDGSRIILQTDAPVHQRLSVSNHNPLRLGTLNGIVLGVSAHKNADRQQWLDILP